MQRTPSKSTPSQNSQLQKRRLTEISPEDGHQYSTECLVGNMSVNSLMSMMKSSMESIMEDKMQTLSTKTDIEEVKTQISDIDLSLTQLKHENEAMRAEIDLLKTERDKDREQIRRLVEQGKRKNVLFRGIIRQGSPKHSVESVCKNILKLSDVKIASARILFSSNDKLGVVAEMQSEDMANKIFKSLRNLAGTSIKVEKDLTEEKQQDRKVLMQLKAEILAIDKTHRVFVKNDSIKIGTHWMWWSKNQELMCGKNCAYEALKDLYGEKLEGVDISYNFLLNKIVPKN